MQHHIRRVRFGTGLLVLALSLSASGTVSAQSLTGSLVVFNAGSLAGPFKELLARFAAENPALETRQESAGSLESARKVTDLGRIPDVIAVADVLIIPDLLVPRHASWYVTFARNSLVLVHSDRSLGAAEINSENWWRVLLRPGVRTGRANPALDPNGYRTLMAIQLAERFYGSPGLGDRLLDAMPQRYVRPKAADLVALVQAGELDYAWSYRSTATAAGLDYVELPREIDLSDAALAESYRAASVRVPGPRQLGADSLTIEGEPIVYALTIPERASNLRAAEAFVALLFSEEGKAVLRRHGFSTLDRPRVAGPGRPPAGLFRPSDHPLLQSTP